MTVNTTKLGPGTLTFGSATADPDFQDASCQLRNGVVAWDKDAEDPFTVLCGDTVAGSVTYTATLSGTMVQDLAEADGIVAWSWDHKGEEVAFQFTPNTAAARSVTGTVVVDPLAVGSTDDFGATMTSDFEWDCVGEPVLGPYVAPAMAETGATAPDLT